MKTVFVSVLLGLALLPLSAEAGLFRRQWGSAVVNTDVTPAGRLARVPTREHPVYYRGMSLGCRFGSVAGDKLPSEQEMNRFIARVMAKQGYLPAPKSMTEPDLFIIVQWGGIKPGAPALSFLGYDSDNDIGASNTGFLGPEVYRQNARSLETFIILDSARDDLYGVSITAFEFKSANTSKPVPYWQTRVGLSAIGKSMADALPTMVATAGPSIGRASPGPVLGDTDDAREGRVTFDELKVIDSDVKDK